MIESILIIIVLIIATERATELLVESKIFEPIRLMIKRWAYPLDQMPSESYYQYFKVMLDYLSTCGYCVSVWVGFFFALFSPMMFKIWIINWFVMGLFLHGASNMYHVLYELLRRGRVHSYDILVKRNNTGE